MNPQREALIDFFEKMAEAARDGRLTTIVVDKKLFLGTESYRCSWVVESPSDNLSGLVGLVKKASAIELAESLKIAAKGGLPK